MKKFCNIYDILIIAGLAGAYFTPAEAQENIFSYECSYEHTIRKIDDTLTTMDEDNGTANIRAMCNHRVPPDVFSSAHTEFEELVEHSDLVTKLANGDIQVKAFDGTIIAIFNADDPDTLSCTHKPNPPKLVVN
ncbi:MAG: hypothetical protein ABJI60_01080 [Kangiellaceae bacterium]